ncbi:hypothetical protein EDC01DRAFT_201955 [Geopyxis carbonaria]|nr:hypothetical protein EDC01DRAFT_201955 [Geopyxis carbonaria]
MEGTQYELDVAAAASSTPGVSVPELGALPLSPSATTELHRRFWDDTFNPEDLALFTDTLFYDTDLERFLDGVTGFDGRELSSSTANERRASAYDEHQNGGAPAASADEFLGAADYLGYDFLNFKIPDLDAVSLAPPEHTQQLSTVSTSPATPAAPPATIQQQNANARAPPPSKPAVLALPTASIHPQTTPDATVTPQQISPTMLSPRELSTSELSPFAGDFSTSSSPQTSPTPKPEYAHLSIQEQAHLAAEEDKRRRNTAASARFRIKKKQRDQALERQTKEMADQVSGLEKKITQLELENRWLRNLLVEKNEKMMEVTGGIAKRTDGVGTGGRH